MSLYRMGRTIWLHMWRYEEWRALILWHGCP
nr:MAG TPA: hypothetical protein [Caudoviricetes sp.]